MACFVLLAITLLGAGLRNPRWLFVAFSVVSGASRHRRYPTCKIDNFRQFFNCWLRRRSAAQKADFHSDCSENISPKNSTAKTSVAKGLPRAQRSCLFGTYLQHTTELINNLSLICILAWTRVPHFSGVIDRKGYWQWTINLIDARC